MMAMRINAGTRPRLEHEKGCQSANVIIGKLTAKLIKLCSRTYCEKAVADTDAVQGDINGQIQTRFQ